MTLYLAPFFNFTGSIKSVCTEIRSNVERFHFRSSPKPGMGMRAERSRWSEALAIAHIEAEISATMRCTVCHAPGECRSKSCRKGLAHPSDDMRCWLDLLGGSGCSIKFVGWEWLELAASHLLSGSGCNLSTRT